MKDVPLPTRSGFFRLVDSSVVLAVFIHPFVVAT